MYVGSLGVTLSPAQIAEAQKLALQVTADIGHIAARARAISLQVIEQEGFLFKVATAVTGGETSKEWADRFVDTVDGMCQMATKIGSDGTPAWAKSPRLVQVISEFVSKEAASRSKDVADLVSFNGQVKGVAQKATAAASQVLQAAMEGALEALKNQFKESPTAALSTIAVVGVAGLVLAAYVWRAFR